jgi:hypothetical protein
LLGDEGAHGSLRAVIITLVRVVGAVSYRKRRLWGSKSVFPSWWSNEGYFSLVAYIILW